MRTSVAVKSAPGVRPNVTIFARVIARHMSGELVVGVDERGGGRREARDHLAFGARGAFEAAEAFEVLGARVGDDADRRADRSRTSSATSPGAFAPISTTANFWPASRRNSVSGTPM